MTEIQYHDNMYLGTLLISVARFVQMVIYQDLVSAVGSLEGFVMSKNAGCGKDRLTYLLRGPRETPSHADLTYQAAIRNN